VREQPGGDHLRGRARHRAGQLEQQRAQQVREHDQPRGIERW